MDFRVFLKTAAADLDLSEVLQQSPDVLLGVSPDAAAQLQQMKAGTVFDLASAALFNAAAQIVDAASDPTSLIGKHLAVPSELVDGGAVGTPLADLPASSVRNLAGVGDQNGPSIESALGVKSIRDLALWPPFVAAKALVAQAYEPSTAIGYDAEAPEELLPRTGQHATQKVIYRKTILLESKPTVKRPWDGGRIDLSQLDEIGFSDVAFGAILTFHQLWTPRRVALGSLLHSLPLGPGESTKVAVVDWTRRLTAASTEDVNQTEVLSSSIAQSTAISEVTSAVASQTQDGRSGGASTAGSQSSGGVAFLGIGIGGASESANAAYASTYSVSNTSRSETATALQNISSNTHQSTSLARSKRAAVITEVSQQESQNITTRSVTNYNHMHALSIQYYEVVQIYETELRTANIERCIFIPMLKINFRNEANIRKYLNVLVRYALDKRTRDLLQQYRNTLVLEYSLDRFATEELTQLIATVDGLPPNAFGSEKDQALGALGLSRPVEKRVQLRLFAVQVAAFRRALALNAEAGYRRGVVEDFDRNTFGTLTLDRGALLNDVYWDTSSGITGVVVQLADGSQVLVGEPGAMGQSRSVHTGWSNAIPIEDVRGVQVQVQGARDGAPSDFNLFELRLQLELAGQIFWLDASFVHSAAFSGVVSVFALRTPVDVEELADLLMEQQLYYSQQVWLRSDPQSLIMQLAPYTIGLDGRDDIHVVDYIDPRPITVAGNYLAFRFTYDTDKVWREWVERQRRDARPRYDLMPIPTGGVFAEAVLGEFNSAEKLDASRFWKWQDSLIPFTAPDIAPLDTGVENRLAAPTPADLQTSGVVKLQDLQPLPAGLATSQDVLNALMAENVFKNMGGVEVTAKLLQAAQTAATNGDKATEDLLKSTANGILTAFEGFANALLKAPDGVQNITQLGSVLNKLGGASGAAGAGGAAADGAAAAGLAEGASGAVEAIGPLLEEIAPLVLLA